LAWLSLFFVGEAGAGEDSEPCAATGDARIWTSSRVAQPGSALRIMAVDADAVLDDVQVFAPDGQSVPVEEVRRGGPPWSVSATVADLEPGLYRIEARHGGQLLACRLVEVGGSVAPDRTTEGWDRPTEAFYSAWVEQLFDGPAEQSLNFPSLDPVLRDRERNFLYGYLGGGEDRGLNASPDCADLPYYLRAYFAWKLGLPMGFRPCSRGSSRAPPRCEGAVLRKDFLRGSASVPVFRDIARQLGDMVHSGSARTGLGDESTDLYPVELTREALWPGTVYADPYGHVLVVAKWVPQSADQPGLLLAVDAQPDNSVSRKRFWEGTFLFDENVPSAGPGFKAFRPLLPRADGGWRALNNEALMDSADHAPFSAEQAHLSKDEFYARMARLINPKGLDPVQAYQTTLDALVEQLETRVGSVDNGEAYFRKNPGASIPMPEGPGIFETIGPWEDYSTPSRDMRLIIAMNVLLDLPEKVVRHPGLFLLGAQSPGEVKARLEDLHRRRIQERGIEYVRSDGRHWKLSVAELLSRKHAFELAYNPNDCAELRWGAPADSGEEISTCRRHAPPAQHARMQQYRNWFALARRPSR
jgi:hypothetical protein